MFSSVLGVFWDFAKDEIIDEIEDVIEDMRPEHFTPEQLKEALERMKKVIDNE